MKSKIVKSVTSDKLEEGVKLIKFKDSDIVLLINFDVDPDSGFVVYSDNDSKLGTRMYIEDEEYSEFHGEIKLKN